MTSMAELTPSELEERKAAVRAEHLIAKAVQHKSEEHRLTRQRAYYHANRDTIREQQRRYRATRRGATHEH